MKKTILAATLVLGFSNPGFAADTAWGDKYDGSSSEEEGEAHKPIIDEPETQDTLKPGEIRRKPSPSPGDDPTYHETLRVNGPREE